MNKNELLKLAAARVFIKQAVWNWWYLIPIIQSALNLGGGISDRINTNRLENSAIGRLGNTVSVLPLIDYLQRSPASEYMGQGNVDRLTNEALAQMGGSSFATPTIAKDLTGNA